MWIRIALFAVMAALAGGCASGTPEACSPLPDGARRQVLVAPMREGIRLDGDLADWKGISFTRVTRASGVFDKDGKPTTSDADLSFRFATCHDNEALYVAVEVADDSIRVDTCEPGAIICPAWEDDAVEVFIDGNHNHAASSRANEGAELRFGGEFGLVANGAANSDYSGYPKTFGNAQTWQGAVDRAMLKGYNPVARYELRITWSVMGLSAAPERIGFTIAAQDDDDGGRRDHALYFVGGPKRPFLDERFFADLVFAK